MTRIERRVLTNSALTGALLTCAVVTAHVLGWLQTPEDWMYDQRAQHFQIHTPAPTADLVHLDIDDRALDGIGRWPWHRSTIAEIIDELTLAGAKAIGLDILFVEGQEPTFETTIADDGSPRAAHEIDHDALLAAAVRRAGDVILPASFALDDKRDTELVYTTVAGELAKDIELSDDEARIRVTRQLPQDANLDKHFGKAFLDARREVVYKRVRHELSVDQTLSPDALRQRLIKRRDASVNSPLSRLIDEQRERYEAIKQLLHFGATAPSNQAAFVDARINLPPILSLSKAMSATAFVDFRTSRDGVLRTQPLVLSSEGRLFPQMGLSLALRFLDATPDDLTFTPDDVTLTCPDGRRIVMPVSQSYSVTQRRDVPAIFNIPWFGDQAWETMYDWPNHRQSAQHLSMNAAYDPIVTHRKIIENNAKVDVAFGTIALSMEMVAEDQKLDFSIPNPLINDDIDTRAIVIDRYLKNAASFIAAYAESPPQADDDGAQAFLRAVASLKNAAHDNVLLKRQLVTQRALLSKALAGKAVLIGWAATGHQDAVPTSLHASCPGVVAHGVIFNAIVTNHFWRVAPPWIAMVFTIGLAFVTVLIAWRFSPLAGLVITSLIGMCYVLLNGLYFFDHLGLIVGLATPQIAIASVWSGCSLARIVIESSERSRITRRFRSYVDPTLVNYLMEREDVRLEGESREMTVCFSDLAGFTSHSERLGERIVALLNRYLGIMVPVITAQRGMVNKFLGDGIMFFFGAPVHNANHAIDAVTTALRMQDALAVFNEELIRENLPPVHMRIGICTGTMVVGDAGSADRSDYTVLGDNVNLAARLESANKMTGTSILISERTAELIDDRFLIRPIGALQVAGKTQGVMTFEVCGFSTDAPEDTRQLCQRTSRVVNHYRSRAFAEALLAADEFDAAHGPSKLTAIYRELCTIHIANPPTDPFDGKIVFTEK